MVGENIAFRRVATGLPVSAAGRLLDVARPYQSERITITSMDFDQSIGGGLLGVASNAVGSSNWSANRAYSIPFVVDHNMIAVKMFIYNGTQVSGNADIGIYAEDGTLLVSSGSTAQAGTSVLQEFNITDTPLRSGIYYMAAALDNGTGHVFRTNPTAVAIQACGLIQQASAFPLPNPATWIAASVAFVPIFGLTGRTLI